MGKVNCSFAVLGLLLCAWLGQGFGSVSGEETSKENKEELSYKFTLQNGDGGQLIWGVEAREVETPEMSKEEEREILETVVFPGVQREAEEGVPKAVWQIGLFHLDGVGTPKDTEKAKAAFRKGLANGEPLGMLFYARILSDRGIVAKQEPEKRDALFDEAEELLTEVVDAGFETSIFPYIQLSKSYYFGWYEMEEDPERAESLLARLEAAFPENPSVQVWRAKTLIDAKMFPEAFELAEKAQLELAKNENPPEAVRKELERARAIKIASAVLSGEMSSLDPDELLAVSREALGIDGAGAWAVPGVLLVILLILLWRTRRSWQTGEGPAIKLSLLWISVTVLAAGIGFNVALPGLDNAVGLWIGAILVTLVTVITISLGGWKRYFGGGPLWNGWKRFAVALGIMVGAIVGVQLIALAWAPVYEMITGRSLDEQFVSMFLDSETLLQLVGTVLIVGVAIPFYEEVMFRGFFYEAIERRWSTRVALIVSSILFALAHGLSFFIPLLFLSFVLGWLRMKTGNLRLCFFLHMLNNSFAVIGGHFSGS